MSVADLQQDDLSEGEKSVQEEQQSYVFVMIWNVLFVFLEGRCHFNPTRRRGITDQSAGLNPGRHSATVVVPCPRLSATPPPPTPSPSPSIHYTIHPESESRLNTVPASRPGLPLPHLPPPWEKVEELSEREMMSQSAVEEQAWEVNLECGASTPSASPSSLSRGSLSDLSRPASSLFSRSTDLASGRSSILCDEPAGETSRTSAAFNGETFYIIHLQLKIFTFVSCILAEFKLMPTAEREHGRGVTVVIY